MCVIGVILKVINVLVLLMMYVMEVEFFMVNSLSGLGNNFIVCSSVVFLIVSIVNMIMMKEMSGKVGKWVFQVVGFILLSISIFYFSGLGLIAMKVFKIILSNGGVDNVFVIGDFIMVRKNFSESEMLDMCLKYWGNYNIRHNTSYLFPEIDVERMISDKKSIREIYGELNGIYNKMHLESLKVKNSWGILKYFEGKGVLMTPDIKFFLCVGGMLLSLVLHEYGRIWNYIYGVKKVVDLNTENDRINVDMGKENVKLMEEFNSKIDSVNGKVDIVNIKVDKMNSDFQKDVKYIDERLIDLVNGNLKLIENVNTKINNVDSLKKEESIKMKDLSDQVSDLSDQVSDIESQQIKVGNVLSDILTKYLTLGVLSELKDLNEIHDEVKKSTGVDKAGWFKYIYGKNQVSDFLVKKKGEGWGFPGGGRKIDE